MSIQPKVRALAIDPSSSGVINLSFSQQINPATWGLWSLPGRRAMLRSLALDINHISTFCFDEQW